MRQASVAILALLVAGCVGLGTGSASASQPSCGDTITKDTKLHKDLVNCPNNGIVIGADDITLNLNGHTVDGDGDGDLGIDNTAGHDGVTIRSGSVREFVEGVLIVGASENHVRKLSTSDQAHGGIGVVDSVDVRVQRNSSVANLVGIYIVGSRDVGVEHNLVSNTEFSGIVLHDESQNVRIAENSVSGSRNDAGIGVYPGDNNVIERNSVSDSNAGIVLAFGSADNTVRANLVTGNGDGVLLDVGTHDNRVTKNRLRDSFFGGVEVVGSDDNVIAQNSVVDNNIDGSEAGIHLLSWPDDPGETSDRNLMSKNTLAGNNGDGILVDADQSQNVVGGNRTRENTDDGIDVDSPSTTLTKNTANHNDDLGIEAIPGVTDGGGNKAHSNGDPRQCLNVVCG